MESRPKINTLEFPPQRRSLPPRARACVCVIASRSRAQAKRCVSNVPGFLRRSVADVNIVTFKQKEDVM